MTTSVAKSESGAIEVTGFISCAADPSFTYYYEQYLSHGSSGSTWRIVRHEDGAKFAMKMTCLSNLSPDALMRTEMEVRCLQSMNHFACIRLHDLHCTKGWLFLVLEYCDAGDLLYQLRPLRDARNRLELQPAEVDGVKDGVEIQVGMEEYRVKFILLQLTLGLHYMHVHKKILHRDLKPANVLLSTNGLVKIGDFGLSNAYDTISGDVGRTLCGTPPYVAPELWQRRRYGRAADMWSLGVLLYECMTSRMPFAGRQLEALQRSIIAEDPPPILGEYSAELRDIVQRLLNKEPTDRPDSTTLLRLPYIQRACNEFPQVLEASKVPVQMQSLIFAQIQKQQLPPQRAIDTSISFEGIVEKFKPPQTFVQRRLKLENGMLFIEKCSPSSSSNRHANGVTPTDSARFSSHMSERQCSSDVPVSPPPQQVPPQPSQNNSVPRPSAYARPGQSQAGHSANLSSSVGSVEMPFSTGSESSSSRRRRGCVALSSIYHVECIDRTFLAIRIDDSDFNFFRTSQAEEWRDVLLQALGIAPSKGGPQWAEQHMLARAAEVKEAVGTKV